MSHDPNCFHCYTFFNSLGLFLITVDVLSLCIILTVHGIGIFNSKVFILLRVVKVIQALRALRVIRIIRLVMCIV